MYDDPKQIQARLTRRDQRNRADWFEVSIDSYYDQKSARTFAVNAAGVQRDGVVGNRGRLDTSWDGIWYSEVQIAEWGWSAELRIPYSMLRFSEGDRQTWGVQFRRRIPRNSEVLEWPLVPRSERRSGIVAEYGQLTNLRNLDASTNLQVAPYTLGRVQTSEDDENPETRQASSTYDVGVDLELGLGANATLNATVNPDFGQVQSDPAVLNLSAFETFFPERRPFFVEGADVFDFSLGRRAELLYTRRVGADAPVIGATKITGRSAEGLVYGAMVATSGDNFDPTRNYGVGRLEQDLGTQSTVGGLVTAFAGPESNGRRRSLSGGLDWDLRFFDQEYQFQGFASSTHRRLSSSDQPTTGYAARTEVGRVQGNWTYNLDFRLLTDTYNPNDVGRLRQNNFFRTRGFVRHEFNGGQPVGPFQRANGFLVVGQSWSYQKRRDRGMGFFSRLSALTEGFRSLSLQLNGDQLFGGYDLFETRGLWPRARPSTYNAEVSAGTDSRRDWELEAEFQGGLRSDGGSSLSSTLETDWNLGSRLKLSGEVSYQVERNALEWATNESFLREGPDQWAIGNRSAVPSDLTPSEFTTLSQGTDRLSTILDDVSPEEAPNGYYVPLYGDRDTDRINLTVRSNVTLTRDLSVEFFGQLFGARGRYRNFQILSSKDDFDAFPTYPKRHDFATSSFLTNAVLRWEFRPGSEFFVVWSQNRALSRDDPYFYDARSSSPFDRSPSARLTDAFDDFAQNTFIVKMRYLFL